MTRRELVLKKLHALSNEEQEEGFKALTLCIRRKLRIGTKYDKTKRGAYSSDNLGDDALSFYLHKTVEALYNPKDGWDWKFEERTFAEQLVRIAEKFISDEPKRYTKKIEKNPLPITEDADISDILYLFDNLEDDSEEKEELSLQLIRMSEECSEGDSDLELYVLMYFEGTEKETIASEMGITKDEVYVLRKKLLRRLQSRKEEIQRK